VEVILHQLAEFQKDGQSYNNGLKIEGKFHTFLCPVKFSGGLGKMPESFSPVQPMAKPVIYFWCLVAWHIKGWMSKRQQQNRRPSTYIRQPNNELFASTVN